MSSTSITAAYSYGRAYGLSVRCFKDKNVAPVLEFDVDGGSLS